MVCGGGGGWRQHGGQDLRGPRLPPDAYCQSIPKYSWSLSAQTLSGTGRRGDAAFYDKVLALRWEVELRHRAQKNTKC